ncbi:MAG: hypothetical protein KAU44_00495, partial [Candidatus Marinimicrobia bacterium]|nr:hypothetical protein [Candidatus Neomarinimicrobiota bacterium]
YLPASEISTIMAKATSADIDFGNMAATRTLQYVLMNVGNTDVYDITFAANDLTIHPSNIALVPTPDEGGDLIALPIVSFTKEHVLPVSGVGSLLDMGIGAFTDVMSLSYNYNIADTASIDSFDITDDYTVSGAKMGAVIEVWVSGKKWENYSVVQTTYDYNDISMLYPEVLYPSQSDTIIVINSGNVPMQMRLINPYLTNYDPEHDCIILDTLIQPDAQIDLSDKLRNEYYFDNSGDDETRGNILIIGAQSEQPYIFTLLNKICTTGCLGLRIGEYYHEAY